MYCTACGDRAKDGTHFCPNCGAPLQEPGAVTSYDPREQRAPSRSSKQPDPYKDQIAELKLEIREAKLHLKQVSTNMSSTRAQYNETSAFVPHGILKRGYKIFEDIRLLGPQQQKQRLQQHVMDLEQELLGLQQAQMQWKTGRS